MYPFKLLTQCIGITLIIGLLLFWLPFSIKIQSPLACLQAGGKYKELENELKDVRTELKKKEQDYATLRDEYHDLEVEMIKQKMRYNDSEKELAAKKEELQSCKNLRDNYVSLQLDGKDDYYKLLLEDKDAYSALQLHEAKLSGNLTIQIRICEERLKACNDQFNVVSDVVPVKEGSEEGGADQCPENDPACYYTKKAGYILQWIMRLGGDTERDNHADQ